MAGVLGAWAACPFFSSEKSCLITSKKLLNGLPGYTEQKTKEKTRKKKQKKRKRKGVRREKENKQMNERASRPGRTPSEMRSEPGVAGGRGAASGQAGGGPLLPHHPGPPHLPGGLASWPAPSGHGGGEATTATNPRAERDPGAPGWRPACPWGQGALSGLGRLGARPLASPGGTAWTHRSAADRQMDGWVDRHGGLGCGRAGGRQPAWEP